MQQRPSSPAASTIRTPIRRLVSDLKAYPTTWAACAAWIVVFIAMMIDQHSGGSSPSWSSSKLLLGMTNGSQFGDLTIRDFRHGEVWRLVTSSFVHYGLVHLAVNLLAMYMLGAVVEGWYGSYQMVLIYVLTGGLGNLVSVLARIELGYSERIHSGGGSVVILGLVALCAVVGRRSRTERGIYLSRQMVKVMILTAALGLGFPLLFKGVGVDNWGHAGGAVVGAVVALGHHWLTRNAGTPRACELGLLSLLVIVGSGIAQAAHDQGVASARMEHALRAKVDELERTYRVLRESKILIAAPQNAPLIALNLERLEGRLDAAGTWTAYRRLRALAAKAKGGALSSEEVAEFQSAAAEVERTVRADLKLGIDELTAFRRKRKPRR